MLAEFWLHHAKRGFHPQDCQHIDADQMLRWSTEEALSHRHTFDKEEHLHKLLHADLYPHPFIGSLSRATVFILYGNPGFGVSDYLDEHQNPSHEAACLRNLSGESDDFFVLGGQSKATGAYEYWHGVFKTSISALAQRLSIPISEAIQIFTRNVCILEATAYHSKKSPGRRFNGLPSSQVARRFVHAHLLPRAKLGDILIFVWRQASFWGSRSAEFGRYRPPSQSGAGQVPV